MQIFLLKVINRSELLLWREFIASDSSFYYRFYYLSFIFIVLVAIDILFIAILDDISGKHMCWSLVKIKWFCFEDSYDLSHIYVLILPLRLWTALFLLWLWHYKFCQLLFFGSIKVLFHPIFADTSCYHSISD